MRVPRRVNPSAANHFVNDLVVSSQLSVGSNPPQKLSGERNQLAFIALPAFEFPPDSYQPWGSQFCRVRRVF
jgi:hypothetical protein